MQVHIKQKFMKNFMVILAFYHTLQPNLITGWLYSQ